MKARTMPGKSRLFIGFTAVLLLLIFALFHSSQNQVDELRLAGLKCEQHEMALRAQYDAQVDKMTVLETGLETSRLSGKDLQQKLRAEKELRDKAVKDANLRFSSLQHLYKSLQSEQADTKSTCETVKKSQLDRINSLTRELTQSITSIEQWKFKYAQLETKFQKLETAMNEKSGGSANAELLRFKNQQLTEELSEMRKHCDFRLPTGNSPIPSSSVASKAQEVQRSFDKQVLVAENTYQIPIHIQSPGVASNSFNTNLSLQTSNRTMDLHRDAPLIVSFTNPVDAQDSWAKPKPGGIINSVENFQILPKPLEEQVVSNDNENVLKEPVAKESKSSTATVIKHDSKSLDRALPIAIIQEQSSVAAKPAVTPQSSSATKGSRKIPDGVVPIPESMNAIFNQDEPLANIKNARYSNAVAADSQLLPAVAASEEDQNPVNFLLQHGNEGENRAHEVNDFNIVEDRNHHDHLQEVLDDAKLVINNNAAEVEAHPGDEDADEKDKRNEIDLAIINRDSHGKDSQVEKKGHEDFVADQGFDDRQEEHVEEEDDDEYPNLAAQQEEGHAVRN